MFFRPALFLVLPLLAAAQDASEKISVHYEVDATSPSEGAIRVRMTVQGIRDPAPAVSMPAWAPGAYRIVTYAKGVCDLTAEADGKRVEIRADDGQTWTVATDGASPWSVSYTVTLPDTPRGGISGEHGDLQGPAAYLYVVDHKDAPCSVSFRIPEGWKIATGLTATDGVFSARDYDTFIDCPTELGSFRLHAFEEGGARYEIAVHSAGEYDGDRLVEICRSIAREQARLFGGVPFERYVFLYHFRGPRGSGGGGLEHLNSTTISMPYAAVRESMDAAAGITSHEFFHLWNVKRIRPRVLGPFDYTGPVHTKALWFCEGVTSYYGDLTLVRCGLWDRGRYLRSLEEEIETLWNNPDRLVTSVEDASWNVWDRARNKAHISYYNKGLLLGLLIDLRIRHETRNRRSLDDVLRFLYRWFVLEEAGPIGVGYEESDLQRAVATVSGLDLEDFFTGTVSGLDELPCETILPYAGIRCVIRSSDVPSLGVRLRRSTVQDLLPGSDTPLRRGDRILAVDGKEMRAEEFREWVRALRGGQEIRLTVRREEQELDFDIVVGTRSMTECRLTWDESPGDLALRIRESWLKGNP